MSKEELLKRVVEVLKTVYDPEIPINIYDLGLIYGVDIGEGDVVSISMTLTSPACPISFFVIQQVVNTVKGVGGVSDVKVNITFDPPWNPTMMTKEGRERFKQLFGYDIVEEYLRSAKMGRSNAG
ncbi:MAG: iron-sulfur cluster assembly protein [Sulfolobales archaeon]|nr:iron-sulfur cluster assembly protein [Sulfolobales archaeon]MDW7968851.1 iron-sulfur cluster assembly protein [Sulfolobales archaeon]